MDKTVQETNIQTTNPYPATCIFEHSEQNREKTHKPQDFPMLFFLENT